MDVTKPSLDPGIGKAGILPEADSDPAELRSRLEHTQEELGRKDRFLEHILATMPTQAYILNLQEKKIVYTNRTSTPFLGFSAEKILAMDEPALTELLHPEDAEHVRTHYEELGQLKFGEMLELELRLKHGYGEWHWVSIRETPFERAPNGQLSQVLGTAEDITVRMQAQEKLWYTSTHDSLTGLYNRPYFEEELARLERGRRFPVTVMVADVDGLRQVNDTLGYPAGDALIRTAAEIIRSGFRGEDVVSRIGGDEFAVLLPDIGIVSIDAIQARVLRKIEAHNNSHPNSPVHITIGFATGERGEALRDIVRQADRRMITNKHTSRNKGTG